MSRQDGESPVGEDVEEDDQQDTSTRNSEAETARSAPRYPIPHRTLAAVEVPAVVQDVDRAVKAFGRTSALSYALNPDQQSLPLYLNPESPFCKPLISHNAQTHNAVLKITVPKRTGRKRKKGSNDPWQGDIEVGDAATSTAEQVCSRSRLDDPRVLRKKLVENVGKYKVEAVGMIKNTHRFRGLGDFYWDVPTKSDFAHRYATQVMPGDVEQIRQFKFKPGTDTGPNVDVIPPPILTHMHLPFNYTYSQNPYVRTTEDGRTFNATAIKTVGYFIAAEEDAPTGPQHIPDMTDSRVLEAFAELKQAFETRPIWTRRALMNHLGGRLRNWNELKKYLNYTAYQFKGGPWRDVVCPYGTDPRTDPKYRQYQTLMFKLLPKTGGNPTNRLWHSLRDESDEFNPSEKGSHIFDGETYHTDGKIWQVCDITDPLLRQLLDSTPIRPTRDPSSGWYHGGLWGKVKAIMKIKLVAIRFGRRLTDEDFASVIGTGDQTPTRTSAGAISMPLPNLGLTTAELTELYGREPGRRAQNSGYSVTVRDQLREFEEDAGELSQGPEYTNEYHNVTSQWFEEDEEDDDDEDDYDEDEDMNDADDGRGAKQSRHRYEMMPGEGYIQYPDIERAMGSSHA